MWMEKPKISYSTKSVIKFMQWYGKHELQVVGYELRVESLKAWVKIQRWKFKSTSYELKSSKQP